jgi:hypothetical protein
MFLAAALMLSVCIWFARTQEFQLHSPSPPPQALAKVSNHADTVSRASGAATVEAAPPVPRKPIEKQTVVEQISTRRLFPSRSPHALVRELEALARDVGHEHAGLPLVGDRECQVSASKSLSMMAISFQFQRIQGSANARSQSVDVTSQIEAVLDSSPQWRRPETVSTLVQILQIEDDPVRAKLVDILSLIPGHEASRALAELAIFDLSERIRDGATDALKTRPLDEFQVRLLEGFRYPWAEVAKHAAETCAELNARELVEPLTALLDKPDPARPVRDADGQWVQTEMVRLNHLSNCTLCHAKASPEGAGFLARATAL